MKEKDTNLVFVVENQHFRQETIKSYFTEDHTHQFVYFKSSSDCLAELHLHPMAVVVDYELNSIDSNEKDAIKILEKIKELEHHTEVVFFSSIDSVEIANDVIKHGAFDYVVLNSLQFYRLHNILDNIEELKFHKKESKNYRLWTWATLFACGILVTTFFVLYKLGYLHEVGSVLIEP